MKTYAEKRFFKYVPDDVAVTIRASSGTYGGGSEVLVLSYQNVTGTVNAGAHPGSYNGQDAYNDMLVVENGTGNGNRSGECRDNEGGVSNLDK